MANWLLPSERDHYTKIIQLLRDRDVDAATMFYDPASNTPVHAVRLNRATGLSRLEEWDGNNWVVAKIDPSGGGTGADTLGGARANLGIGTMGLQNNNAITVTGGSITGLAVLDMSGNITFFANDSYSIGTIAKQVKNLFVSSGFKLPVGIDKWIVK